MRLLAWPIFALLLLGFAANTHADWEVKRSPFNARIVERYRAMLRRDPDDPFAWKRLIALYKNFRTLDELARDFKARAEHGGDFLDLYLLGRLARERGNFEEADERFRKALEVKPGDAGATLALAEIDLRLGHRNEAKRGFAIALTELENRDPRQPRVLRVLADLALEDKDIDEAKRRFGEILARSPGDLDLRRELAEALAAHDRFAEALAAWQEIEPRLAAQPERRAEALRRIGELSEAVGEDTAALDQYRRALAMVPRGHYLQRELTDKIIGVYRRKDDLRTLIAREEKAFGAERGFFEWETLARLYEEVGDAVAATAALRRALALDPHALEVRKRLIALLDRNGRDDEALLEHQKLCAEAPGDARLQIELAERLARGGPDGKKKALELLAKVAARAPRDPSVHSALAELYNRWGEVESAQREQELLARLEPGDETHVVDLGEIYWQRGKRKLALDTWHKLVSLSRDRAAGMARLADVLGDHDLSGESVELYEKAEKLAPGDFAIRRGLAAALERMRRGDEAESAWMAIFAEARSPKLRALRLEARQRLVAIAHAEGRLASRIIDLRARFEGPPPDDDWGLVLADAYLKLGRTDDAEAVLTSLEARAASDEAKGEAAIGLGQVQKQQRNLKGAIAAFERAAKLLPSRARELYGQIAELSLALYHDDDALAFANRAAALGPGDPQAEVRLAEIHEKKDEDEAAIAAYKKALALDRKLFHVDFALARLYLRRGAPEEAAKLYREVVLRAPEEEMVLDAARRAIDLEEYLGTLGDLSRALTPLAYLGVPKPVYRKVLIELYDRYGTPLVVRARAGDAAAARELERLGEHGMKPLLEALSFGEPSEQRIAVALLGELHHQSASAPLLRLAVRVPEPAATDRSRWPDIDLRVAATLAGGALADPRSLADLTILAGEREKHLRLAALDGLSRQHDRRALSIVILALADRSPDVQAMACLGVARLGADGKTKATVRAMVADGARSETVRAACAIALGATGDGAAIELLEGLLRDGDGDAQRAAAWALGAIGDRRAEPALLRAVFFKQEEIRQVAAEALERLGRAPRRTGVEAVPGDPTAEVRNADGLALPAIIARLAQPSRSVPTRPLLTVGATFAAHAATAIGLALDREHDLPLRTLADLVDEPAGSTLALGPIRLDTVDRQRVSRDVATRIEPAIVKLARSGDAVVRARAVAVLALLPSTVAAAARTAALADASIDVRLAALASFARHPDGTSPDAAEHLAGMLAAKNWQERAAAAGAFAHADAVPATERVAALTHLLDDRNGFVRERAALALGPLGAPAVASLTDHAREPIIEVRRAIAEALGATADGQARAALVALERDGDPSVRSAAQASLARLPAP